MHAGCISVLPFWPAYEFIIGSFFNQSLFPTTTQLNSASQLPMSTRELH